MTNRDDQIAEIANLLSFYSYEGLDPHLWETARAAAQARFDREQAESERADAREHVETYREQLDTFREAIQTAADLKDLVDRLTWSEYDHQDFSEITNGLTNLVTELDGGYYDTHEAYESAVEKLRNLEARDGS